MAETSYTLFSDDAPLDAGWPRPYAGIDEAGRGCLAGPVVAGAVILPEQHAIIGLTDSKKLSEKKREELFPLIMQEASHWALGLAWPAEIDRINILQATFLAMSRAVQGLHSFAPLLAIDGNQNIPVELLANSSARQEQLPDFAAYTALQEWDCQSVFPVVYSSGQQEAAEAGPEKHQSVLWATAAQKTIVKGDLKIPAISAASVLAKTFRDHLMVRLDAAHPGYGFAKHKGYGTKEHLASILALGPCSQHRMTFGGVRQKPDTPKATTQGSLLHT